MTNKEIATKFFDCYQRHDYAGMQSCLDPEVQFDDLAFKGIRGVEVLAMWRWFCEKSDRRKEPVAVPVFKISRAEGECVTVRYRVQYALRDNPEAKRREVDYEIDAHLTFRNGRIEKHRDESTISQFAFARMAVGFPACLAALTPLFRWKLRSQSIEKLYQYQASQTRQIRRKSGPAP